MRVTGLRLTIESVVLLGLLVAAAWCMRSLPFSAGERAAAWQAASGRVRLSGTVSPARLGPNRVDVAFETGALIDVSFLPVGGEGVVARRLLTEASPGRYGSSGFVISRPGAWQMLIGVEKPGQAPAFVAVDWEVGADGGLWRLDETRPWLAQWLAWLNTSGSAALTAVVVLIVGGWGWRVGRWVRARG